MEIAAYAHALVTGTSLAAKCALPPDGVAALTDLHPEALAAPTSPGRPDNLQMNPHRKVRTPPLAGMVDPEQRARIIHAFANHELQAIELFAWALLAFPREPRAFRMGLLAIIGEEQRHFSLYCDWLETVGVPFGSQPVTGHFWNKLDQLATPLRFVCAMGLTFENANLDFAAEYEAAARRVGDLQLADALRIVHEDEIRHVKFAWRWLETWKDADRSAWQTYLDTVEFPLGPARARGATFDAEARRRAGLDEEFIKNLEDVVAKRPGGHPR